MFVNKVIKIIKTNKMIKNNSNKKSLVFLRELGRCLARKSDDPRESAYFFQRLPVAIQRFNAVCVAGILCDSLVTV
jgi:hypothetical protein